MSYYYDKYEFTGQDSAGFRGGEEFFEPTLEYGYVSTDSSVGAVPKAISVETYQ